MDFHREEYNLTRREKQKKPPQRRIHDDLQSFFRHKFRCNKALLAQFGTPCVCLSIYLSSFLPSPWAGGLLPPTDHRLCIITTTGPRDSSALRPCQNKHIGYKLGDESLNENWNLFAHHYWSSLQLLLLLLQAIVYLLCAQLRHLLLVSNRLRNLHGCPKDDSGGAKLCGG